MSVTDIKAEIAYQMDTFDIDAGEAAENVADEQGMDWGTVIDAYYSIDLSDLI